MLGIFIRMMGVCKKFEFLRVLSVTTSFTQGSLIENGKEIQPSWVHNIRNTYQNKIILFSFYCSMMFTSLPKILLRYNAEEA